MIQGGSPMQSIESVRGERRATTHPGLPLLGAILALAFAVSGSAQPPSVAPESMKPESSTGGDRKHGTPVGWRFTWPKGDAARGRDVFVKLECQSCHEVRGERFPA